jgi:hypothetical protein
MVIRVFTTNRGHSRTQCEKLLQLDACVLAVLQIRILALIQHVNLDVPVLKHHYGEHIRVSNQTIGVGF